MANYLTNRVLPNTRQVFLPWRFLLCFSCFWLPVCLQEWEACQDDSQGSVWGARDWMPVWLLPIWGLVLLPRWHILCHDCWWLSINCQKSEHNCQQEWEACQDDCQGSMWGWWDCMRGWLLPCWGLDLLPRWHVLCWESCWMSTSCQNLSKLAGKKLF